jgi:hypothetical protein
MTIGEELKPLLTQLIGSGTIDKENIEHFYQMAIDGGVSPDASLIEIMKAARVELERRTELMHLLIDRAVATAEEWRGDLGEPTIDLGLLFKVALTALVEAPPNLAVQEIFADAMRRYHRERGGEVDA